MSSAAKGSTPPPAVAGRFVVRLGFIPEGETEPIWWKANLYDEADAAGLQRTARQRPVDGFILSWATKLYVREVEPRG